MALQGALVSLIVQGFAIYLDTGVLLLTGTAWF